MTMSNETVIVDSAVKTNDIATSNVKNDSNTKKKIMSNKNLVSVIFNTSNGIILNKHNRSDKVIRLIYYDYEYTF